MRPTIYIPSELTKLLIPLPFPQREALPTLAGVRGSRDRHQASSADRDRARPRGLGDWRACSDRWKASLSQCS
jgi:hypothetical protein